MNENLRGKQEAQQRARSMARELISSILEIQLKQLKQNGMEKLPIYGEIETMRQNLDHLVEAEMREVVDLLVKAQSGPAAERQAKFVQAREKIRDIVVRLSVERQNLLRRLKVAELAAQVRRLIQLQSAVLAVVDTLPEQPKNRQETLGLSATQDQRDVKVMFFRLVDTLEDVSAWGGPVGAGAADGIRILKAAQVGAELDQAGTHLEEARYAPAANSQKVVIRGLRLLLEKIEETQGLIGTGTDEALQKVEALIAKQEAIREKTRETPANEKAAEKLIEDQAQLRKELNQLSETLEKQPTAEPLLEQAKAAAFEATADLFDAKRPEAVREQSKVLGNLAAIAEQLQNAADPTRSTMSAQQLAQQLQQLHEAQKELVPAQAQQHQAAAAAKQRSLGRSRAGAQCG